MSKKITIHVLEGSDKGIAFRSLDLPVSIGREEGNNIRLSDERISRFHAKIQDDSGEIILTDLESTNGTRVNGNTIQFCYLVQKLRFGIESMQFRALQKQQGKPNLRMTQIKALIKPQ